MLDHQQENSDDIKAYKQIMMETTDKTTRAWSAEAEKNLMEEEQPVQISYSFLCNHKYESGEWN